MLKYWALNDGYLDVKQRELFGEGVEDIKFRLPIHSFLIKTEDQLILVDTGCGKYFGPTAGHIAKGLAAIGYKPEQITMVLLTHLHPDHIGGLPLFSNATICISDIELEYWLNERGNVSEYNLKYIPFVNEMLTLIEGDILLFKPNEILFPGITPIEAYGHTPGHTAFLFDAKDQKILFWGDLIHNVELQFLHPGRFVIIDDNPEAAAITRLHLLKRSLDENLLVGGAHLPGTGVGHVKNKSGFFEFIS